MIKQRGFTLIELLVVIAIIGILSSVVLASLTSARNRAQDAKRYSDLRQLQTALELSYSNTGTYPPHDSLLQVSLSLGSLAPTYIPAIPTDPVHTAGGGYRYCASTVAGVQTSYRMIAQTTRNNGWCYVGAGPLDSCGWASYPRCGQ